MSAIVRRRGCCCGDPSTCPCPYECETCGTKVKTYCTGARVTVPAVSITSSGSGSESGNAYVGVCPVGGPSYSYPDAPYVLVGAGQIWDFDYSVSATANAPPELPFHWNTGAENGRSRGYRRSYRVNGSASYTFDALAQNGIAVSASSSDLQPTLLNPTFQGLCHATPPFDPYHDYTVNVQNVTAGVSEVYSEETIDTEHIFHPGRARAFGPYHEWSAAAVRTVINDATLSATFSGYPTDQDFDGDVEPGTVTAQAQQTSPLYQGVEVSPGLAFYSGNGETGGAQFHANSTKLAGVRGATGNPNHIAAEDNVAICNGGSVGASYIEQTSTGSLSGSFSMTYGGGQRLSTLGCLDCPRALIVEGTLTLTVYAGNGMLYNGDPELDENGEAVPPVKAQVPFYARLVQSNPDLSQIAPGVEIIGQCNVYACHWEGPISFYTGNDEEGFEEESYASLDRIGPRLYRFAHGGSSGDQALGIKTSAGCPHTVVDVEQFPMDRRFDADSRQYEPVHGSFFTSHSVGITPAVRYASDPEYYCDCAPACEHSAVTATVVGNGVTATVTSSLAESDDPCTFLFEDQSAGFTGSYEYVPNFGRYELRLYQVGTGDLVLFAYRYCGEGGQLGPLDVQAQGGPFGVTEEPIARIE